MTPRAPQPRLCPPAAAPVDSRRNRPYTRRRQMRIATGQRVMCRLCQSQTGTA
ncbi:hypothetical protein [Neotabrizicola sp. VNH66]|uniref:hypothetical protein n=1 Tax=Neotabrizicola sp. VNH66 TaxID=3400918 RepID=UPI003C0527B8